MTALRRLKTPSIFTAAALMVVLAACGAQQATEGSPTGDGGGAGSQVDPDQQWLEIAVVHAPEVGASAAPGPVLVEDGQQIRSYSATFGASEPQMRKDIRDALESTEIPDGWRSIAAVVSVGCLAPKAVEIRGGQLVANVSNDKDVNCFVAHSYVAVIAASPEFADELLAAAVR